MRISEGARRARAGRTFASVAAAVVVATTGVYAGCRGGADASGTAEIDAGSSCDGRCAESSDAHEAAPAPTALNDASSAIDATEASASNDAGLLPSAEAGAADATVNAATDDSGVVVDAASTIDCSPNAGGAIGPSGAPALLACTGLYADWASFMIAPSAIPYDPGIHLWSDGAVKSRYISLPPGTQIDTSDMDEWTFPIGTKVWKQFVVGGKKVETRYLTKRGTSDWVWTTYQWSTDQTSATELTTGATNVNGTGYEIPYLDECRVCHMGRLDFVLGFEAIGLSTPQATGLPMAALVANGWLTAPPSAPLVIPGDATSSAALGWLHANCGTACHNPSTYSLAGSTGFFMRLEAAKLGSVEATDTYTTGVNVQAKFKPPDGGSLMRIAPGNPAGSCVIFRDSYRDTQGEGIQMPPIDTHVVNSADVAVVGSWISSL